MNPRQHRQTHRESSRPRWFFFYLVLFEHKSQCVCVTCSEFVVAVHESTFTQGTVNLHLPPGGDWMSQSRRNYGWYGSAQIADTSFCLSALLRFPTPASSPTTAFDSPFLLLSPLVHKQLIPHPSPLRCFLCEYAHRTVPPTWQNPPLHTSPAQFATWWHANRVIPTVVLAPFPGHAARINVPFYNKVIWSDFRPRDPDKWACSRELYLLLSLVAGLGLF